MEFKPLDPSSSKKRVDCAVVLRNLFSRSNRDKSRASKFIKTATNAYTQSGERYNAMQQLLDIAGNSENEEQLNEAFVGLFKRFTVTSTKSIEDEEEKSWVYRRLSAVGKPVLPALEQFVIEAESIAWALRILEEIADEDEEWKVLDALLKTHPPGLGREGPKKIQFLTHLQEIDSPRVPKVLAEYLEDPDEPVRFAVVEGLIDIGELESLEPLANRLSNSEEDSLRLKTRILDGFANLDWDITSVREQIGSHLGHDHTIVNNKVVRR